jgi:hypothetical protein
VAVVQAAEQASGGLAFRLLVLPRKSYAGWIGNPFAVADRYPPDWQTAGSLETLEWPEEPLPRRLAEATQHILKHGDSPTLLGGVQALVDGGRMVYERPAPAPELVRDLWALLPHTTRNDIWPASFAFSNALDFHVLVVPQAGARDYAGYLTEEQAGDYPQGRYELDLQIAAEAGDQEELDRLFYRRSSSATLRLALVLVAVMAVLAFVSQVGQHVLHGPRATAVQAPLKDRYPELPAATRPELTAALRQFAEQVGVQPLPDPATAESLLLAIDTRLGSPSPQRDPGPLDRQGGLERQLRVLLWKHDVPRFDDESLNVLELVEHLRARQAK